MVSQSQYIRYDWLWYSTITYTLFVWTICTAARWQNGCQYQKGPHLASNKQHRCLQLISSDTSKPMAPGQHSLVLFIGIQVVQPSKEYSVMPSNRFIPLVPSRGATNRIKVSNQSKCLNKSPESIHSICLTWIVWNHFYIVGLEYLYSSKTIEEVSVREEPIAPSRSQHFNTELTSWNKDTCRQLQQHSPCDNSKRWVNMLAYMRHIMSQESWDVLLTSAQRQDSS
jgi:hypothetical protein